MDLHNLLKNSGKKSFSPKKAKTKEEKKKSIVKTNSKNSSKRKSITADDIARQKDRQSMKEKVKDILPSLQVMPTFSVPDECLIPQDLDQIIFDVQVPQGYDIGQVTQFNLKVKKTVKFYWALLEQRNDDVVKLANVIYQLQENIDNLLRENAVSEGVNIMATEDDEELGVALMEAKLKIARLEDEIKKLRKTSQNGSRNSSNDDELESLKNEINELSYTVDSKDEEIELLTIELNNLKKKNESSERVDSDDDYDDTSILDRYEMPEYSLPSEPEDDEESDREDSSTSKNLENSDSFTLGDHDDESDPESNVDLNSLIDNDDESLDEESLLKYLDESDENEKDTTLGIEDYLDDDEETVERHSLEKNKSDKENKIVMEDLPEELQNDDEPVNLPVYSKGNIELPSIDGSSRYNKTLTDDMKNQLLESEEEIDDLDLLMNGEE